MKIDSLYLRQRNTHCGDHVLTAGCIDCGPTTCPCAGHEDGVSVIATYSKMAKAHCDDESTVGRMWLWALSDDARMLPAIMQRRHGVDKSRRSNQPAARK